MSVFAPMIVLAACIPMAAADGPAQGAKDPQARVEPRSGPGEGQRLLQTFAGDWNVIKVFHPRAGAPVRAEGTCRQTMIHDGRFLQSDFAFQRDGKTTTGLGIIGFEPESGTFTSVWTDSRQTRMSLRQSRGRFDGTQIVLHSTSLDASGPAAQPTKTVTRLEPDGRTLVHRQYALSPDGSEWLMMELTMTRKPTTATTSD